MKKLIAVLTLVSILTLSAAAKSKESSRVENAGEVMTEIIECSRRYSTTAYRQGRVRHRASLGG